MKKLYYDAFLDGLIEVEPIGRLEGRVPGCSSPYVVRIAKTHRAWKKGELIRSRFGNLVVKTRSTGFHQLVKTPYNLLERFEAAEQDPAKQEALKRFDCEERQMISDFFKQNRR